VGNVTVNFYVRKNFSIETVENAILYFKKQKNKKTGYMKNQAELEREEEIRLFNLEIARDSSWLCAFFQEKKLSATEKQLFIKSLVRDFVN